MSAPLSFWVPGRIEFLGKHTDYAGGRSLLCAVERGIRLQASPRADRLVRIGDKASGETAEVALHASIVPREGDWAIYPGTVARRIARNFPGRLVGADITFCSDLPPAAGMSSSSALVVAVFLALSALNDLAGREEYQRNIHEPEELAEYLGCIEGGFTFGDLVGDAGVGTLSGCEDQTALLCGRPDCLVQYSFCPVRFERSLAMPAGYTFVIASSGVVAEKTRSALDKYNRLSRQAVAAAEVWRRATGRSDATLGAAVASSEGAADTMRDVLRKGHADGFSSAELMSRFEQFVDESEAIVPGAAAALAEGNLGRLGTLVDRSQRGAERRLRNQVPETIALARSARELGAVAASAFGAGFGGSVWALVAEADSGEYLNTWRRRYLERFPARAATAHFFVTRAGSPAARLA